MKDDTLYKIFHIHHELDLRGKRDTINAPEAQRYFWMFEYLFAVKINTGYLLDNFDFETGKISNKGYKSINRAKEQTAKILCFLASACQLVGVNSSDVANTLSRRYGNLVSNIDDAYTILNCKKMYLNTDSNKNECDFKPCKSNKVFTHTLCLDRMIESVIDRHITWKWFHNFSGVTPKTQFREVHSIHNLREELITCIDALFGIVCLLKMSDRDLFDECNVYGNVPK